MYVTKGGSEAEVYEPSFTYHGCDLAAPHSPDCSGALSYSYCGYRFRYVEMTVDGGLLPTPPNVSTIVGLVLRSSVVETSLLRFGEDPRASGNLLQKLSNNSWWTEASALMSIPAGAAARGERNGWTGDAAFASESECFDFGTGSFFSRYLEQVADSQGPNGEIGAGVPSQGTDPTTLHPAQQTPMDPSWSAVFPVVAFNVWKYHNATPALEYAWSGLQLYYSMLQSRYSVSPYTYACWGDWNPAYPEPRNPDGAGPPFTRTVSHITAAAMVVQNFIQMAELSRGVGRLEEAAAYESLLPTMKQQYHNSFFDPEAKIYGDGTPTAFGAALWLGVTPPELLPTVVENFIKQLASVQYRMASVGFIGVRYIFEALAKVNRTDVALLMLNVTEYPSFGFQIANSLEPATTLWECFDEPTMHQWIDESSRNHHYSASINTFLRKHLAGLDMPEGSNSWEVVKCRPEAVHWPHLLPTASAVLHSKRGLVSCSWQAHPPEPPLPPPVLDLPSVLCAVSPRFTGCVAGPAPLLLRCPVGANITELQFARWGQANGDWGGPNGWYCYGPQPPPPGACEADVSTTFAPLCVGKNSCDLSNFDSGSLGSPCASNSSGTYQLIVRVACSFVPLASSASLRTRNEGIEATRLLHGSPWAFVNTTVPGGSSGEVHVPVRNGGTSGTITESGQVVWMDGSFTTPMPDGLTAIENDGRFVIFGTDSGSYEFSSML